MNRTAQIQLIETIAILFIFFLLLLLGIVFYYHYQKSAIKEQGQELTRTKALEAGLQALFLPELMCSRGEAEPEDNCLDSKKLQAANETLRKYNSQYYFSLFSYANITVQVLYPEPKSYYLYAQKRETTKSYLPTFFVVVLRDQSPGEELSYQYGYLEVGVYS